MAQPDENSGEAVALFVVKKDPNLTAEALIEYCRAEPHRLQGAEARVLPQPSCRRPTSARSCAGRCAMSCARPAARRRPAPRAPRPLSRGQLSRGVTAHRLDEHRDLLGIDVGRDAVTQIEHVARARPEALEHPRGLGAQRVRGREQRGRIEIALQRDAVRRRRAGPASSPWSNRRPPRRSRSPRSAASHAPPPLVNTMFGTRRPSASRVSAGDDLRHVVQGELRDIARASARRPRCRTASPPARPPRSARSDTESWLARAASSSRCSTAGASYIMRLMSPKVLAAAALDHVGARPSRDCPRSRSAARGRRARGGSAPPRRSRT